MMRSIKKCQYLTKGSPKIFLSKPKNTKEVTLKSRYVPSKKCEFACVTMKYKVSGKSRSRSRGRSRSLKKVKTVRSRSKSRSKSRK